MARPKELIDSVALPPSMAGVLRTVDTIIDSGIAGPARPVSSSSEALDQREEAPAATDRVAKVAAQSNTDEFVKRDFDKSHGPTQKAAEI
jgi:hypothetical protein